MCAIAMHPCQSTVTLLLFDNDKIEVCVRRTRRGRTGPLPARQCTSDMAGRPRPRKLRLALLHVNILLMVGAGALLVGGARLAWDPTTYIPLRELWPIEHAVATVAIPAAGLSLLVLAHVTAAAATVETAQRALLITVGCSKMRQWRRVALVR
ncbi:hypothetical protein EVAR_20238_1 [Eumeta japonica]|uniref:Uncharacterized protein n=1 Tax=Eumeta variegata TaxID=151549 RepID=A0A4C1WAS2_EUMVA|nr:hypothetical protein EVAR_20238_1 [Eumeta japonica]